MGATSSKGPRITPRDRAVLDLKLQRDRIRRYQVKLQYVLDRELAIARDAFALGDKGRARLALQSRAYQRSLIEKMDEQLATLQQLATTIEYAAMEQSIMHGLERGNEVLRKIHSEMDIERVERLMDNTAEAQQYQQDVADRLAAQLSADEQAAVDAEMEALGATVNAEAAPSAPVPSAPMPSVPPSLPTDPPAAVASSSTYTHKQPLAEQT